MARKKKRKLAFTPDAAQGSDSGNHVSWFGTADRLTDSSSHKAGDAPSNDPLTGRNILTGAQETRREGAASQPMTPAQAFADAVLHGDPAQIKATKNNLPPAGTLAAVKTALEVKSIFTAMPQDQRDTVIKNVDANAGIFGGPDSFAVKSFHNFIETAPPATHQHSTDPVALTGQDAARNMKESGLFKAGSGSVALAGRDSMQLAVGLGAGASNQAHLDGVDTRLVAAWDYAAAKTGERYSLVGPRSGTRSVEDARKNAAAGIGVEHSLHIADKSGVGHAGDLYVNGKTPTPAFAAAVKEYAAQEGYHVRWGGTDFRLPNGNRDPNHFDLGTRVGGVAFKTGADPVAVAMAAPAKGGSVESYIRQAAVERGIDPNVAVRVAKGEGGLSDPLQQSYVVKDGKRETSYGPFQLRIGGGLGDKALAAGIDPRKQSDWQKGVDFALNHAAVHGWGEWYGAVNPGPKSGLSPIGVRAGLDGAKPVAVGATMIAGAGGQDVAVGGDKSAGGAAALAAGIGNHGLRKGSGNVVATKALQSVLNDLGATDRAGSALKVDGKFGPRTYEAVKNYQADAGITQDGIVGPQTFKHINSDMSHATGFEGSPELGGRDRSAVAIKALNLTPQEQHLYEHHLDSLHNGNLVRNEDGSTSTIFQIGTEHNGRDYNIPSVWNGKILNEQDAIKKAIGDGRGWDYWPSYPHDSSLPDTQEGWAKQPSEVRYGQMHNAMEQDIPGPQQEPFGVHVGTEGSPELAGQHPDSSRQSGPLYGGPGPRFFAGPGPGKGPTARDYAAGMAVAAVTVDPFVSRAVRIPTGLPDMRHPQPADDSLMAYVNHALAAPSIHRAGEPADSSLQAYAEHSDPYRPTGGSNGSFTGAVSGGSSSSGSFDSFAAGMSHTYQTVQSGGSVAPQPSYSVGGAGVYTPPAHVSTVNDGYSPPTTFTTGNNGQIVGGI